MNSKFFQDRKKKSNLYNWLILIVLFFVLILMGRAVWSLWQKNELAESNRVLSEKHLKALIEREKTLRQKIIKLQTLRGVEEEIRTNYSVVKPGEKVINIVENEKATQTATTTPAVKSWWQIF